ncbi:MAG: hypothetical protein ACON4X_03955 [Polaribacter sp.]
MKNFIVIVALCMTSFLIAQEKKKDSVVEPIKKDSIVKKIEKHTTVIKVVRDSIIGVWNVTEINKAPKSAGFKQMIDGYKKASFDFKKDSTLSLSTESPNVIFNYVLKAVNKSRWIANDSMILIGTEKNKYSTMRIRVIQKPDAVLFKLNERTNLPLILQLQKEK